MTTFDLGGCRLNGLSIRNASADVSTSPWLHVSIVGLIGAGGGVAFGVVTLLVTEADAVDSTLCGLIGGSSFGVVVFDITVKRKITYNVQRYLTTFHDFCESKDII